MMGKIGKTFFVGMIAVGLVSCTACSSKKENKEEVVKVDDVSQKITKAGTYELSGEIEGGIVVDADKEDEITLVLNGVNLSSEEDAAIKVLKAKKVTIMLKEDTKNYIEDSGERNGLKASEVESQDSTEEEYDAAIYSKSDLYFEGTGELQITANYKDAISGKDSVYIEEGNYKIQAENHAVKGKDYLEIQDGNFEINCTQDAFHSNGDFLILSGSFSVNVGDDAFHADEALKIEDGVIDISSCNEGLEGRSVTILNGEISIVSSDDGINAASSSETTETENKRGNMFEVNEENEIRVEGGHIYINANGDGIDSNGNVTISGGTIEVDGCENSGNGALDYNGTCDITGGSLIAVGSSGMAQGISDSSSLYGIMMTLNTKMKEGTNITLEGEEGELILYTPTKTFNNVVIADARLEQGKEYTLKVGDDILVSFTISDTMTYLDENGVTEKQNGMKGNFGKGGSMDPDQMPEGFEPPEGVDLPEGKERPGKMEFPEGQERPEKMELPEGMEMYKGGDKKSEIEKTEE